MGSTTIIELKNTDADFYPTLGPFLARRDVHAYLGGPMWDDDHKIWFVAFDAAGRVAGFAAVATHGRKLYLESLYLVDGESAKTARRLVSAAVRRYDGHILVASVRREHADPYLESGFVQVNETKNFVSLIRAGKDT